MQFWMKTKRFFETFNYQNFLFCLDITLWYFYYNILDTCSSRITYFNFVLVLDKETNINYFKFKIYFSKANHNEGKKVTMKKLLRNYEDANKYLREQSINRDKY